MKNAPIESITCIVCNSFNIMCVMTTVEPFIKFIYCWVIFYLLPSSWWFLHSTLFKCKSSWCTYRDVVNCSLPYCNEMIAFLAFFYIIDIYRICLSFFYYIPTIEFVDFTFETPRPTWKSTVLPPGKLFNIGQWK